MSGLQHINPGRGLFSGLAHFLNRHLVVTPSVAHLTTFSPHLDKKNKNVALMGRLGTHLFECSYFELTSFAQTTFSIQEQRLQAGLDFGLSALIPYRAYQFGNGIAVTGTIGIDSALHGFNAGAELTFRIFTAEIGLFAKQSIERQPAGQALDSFSPYLFGIRLGYAWPIVHSE